MSDFEKRLSEIRDSANKAAGSSSSSTQPSKYLLEKALHEASDLVFKLLVTVKNTNTRDGEVRKEDAPGGIRYRLICNKQTATGSILHAPIRKRKYVLYADYYRDYDAAVRIEYDYPTWQEISVDIVVTHHRIRIGNLSYDPQKESIADIRPKVEDFLLDAVNKLIQGGYKCSDTTPYSQEAEDSALRAEPLYQQYVKQGEKERKRAKKIEREREADPRWVKEPKEGWTYRG